MKRLLISFLCGIAIVALIGAVQVPPVPTAGFQTQVRFIDQTLVSWYTCSEFFEIRYSTNNTTWQVLSAGRRTPVTNSPTPCVVLLDTRQRAQQRSYALFPITREAWLAYDALPMPTNPLPFGLLITE